MVAVIPIELYEQLSAEREARFQVLDHIRGKLPQVSESEVLADIRAAIRAVRNSDAARRA